MATQPVLVKKSWSKTKRDSQARKGPEGWGNVMGWEGDKREWTGKKWNMHVWNCQRTNLINGKRIRSEGRNDVTFRKFDTAGDYHK